MGLNFFALHAYILSRSPEVESEVNELEGIYKSIPYYFTLINQISKIFIYRMF